MSVAWCRPDQLRPGCAALMATACTHAHIKVVGSWPGHCCIQTGLWWSGLQPDCHVSIAADAGEAGHRGPQPLLPGILRLSDNHQQKLICSTMAGLQGDAHHLYSALLHRGSHPCMAAFKAPSMLDAGFSPDFPGRGRRNDSLGSDQGADPDGVLGSLRIRVQGLPLRTHGIRVCTATGQAPHTPVLSAALLCRGPCAGGESGLGPAPSPGFPSRSWQGDRFGADQDAVPHGQAGPRRQPHVG